jgi:RecA/RadA recombinase
MDHHADRTAALASLRARWGAAAPRPAVEVFGALAAAPFPAEVGAALALPEGVLSRPGVGLGALPESLPIPTRPALVPLPGGARPSPAPAIRQLPGEPEGGVDRRISTGFPDLDALLASGGLPRAGTVVLRGSGSSGATTLALRTVAEAQAGGALVAWVDLARSLDPVEAVARGVDLEWLAVLVPGSVDEALAMAGSLLQARAVDLLVLDLAGARDGPALSGAVPAMSPAAPATNTALTVAHAAPAGHRAGSPPTRPPRLADQLGRLVAFARRAGALLLVLDPAGVPASLRAALDEGAGLRLELRRRGWIRLGREVVGQRTEVRVAKDHHGAPDRRAAIRLLYAEGGPRDRCLARDDLLAETVAGTTDAVGTAGAVAAGLAPLFAAAPFTSSEHQGSNDAPPPPRLAPSRPPARAGARSRDSGHWAADPRRAAVG